MNIRFTLDHTTIYTLNFVFGKITNAIPLHSHGSNCYEIHYIPNGYGRLLADGVPYDIVPNTLYVTGPHCNHAQFPYASDPMEEYCLYLRLEPSSHVKKDDSILPVFTAFPFWFGADTQNLLQLFTELTYESQHTDLGKNEKIKALLSEILIGIVRNYQKEPTCFYSSENTFCSNQKSLAIEEYFLCEYANLSLTDLSNHLHLSIRQTERILKQYYNKNFQQMKLEAKMSIAEILLRENNSISSVATTLGFSSLEHFSSTFKKYYDISPTQFKKSCLY